MDTFLSAFIGAMLSTIPIGPINLILMQLILSRRWKTWAICLSAAVLADGLICFLCLKFFDFVKYRVGTYLSFSPVILSVFLAISGLAMFFAKQTPEPLTPKRSYLGYFIFSFFLTLSGPALAPFWLSWWSTAHQTSPNLLMAAIGFTLGDVLVFAFYGFLVFLFPKPGFEMQRKISRGLALVLVAAGIVVFVSWMNGVSLWERLDEYKKAKSSDLA